MSSSVYYQFLRKQSALFSLLMVLCFQGPQGPDGLPGQVGPRGPDGYPVSVDVPVTFTRITPISLSSLVTLSILTVL